MVQVAATLGEGGSAVVVYDNTRKILYAAAHKEFNYITNNQAELNALLYAMYWCKTKFKDEYCTIYCDSAYCVNMCNDWIWNWAKNGWKNSKKQTVENLELVQEIHKHLTNNHNFKIEKIAGHNPANVGNCLADALASGQRQKFDKIIKEHKISYWLNDFLEIF